MHCLSAEDLRPALKAHGARSLLGIGQDATALMSQFAALAEFECFELGGAAASGNGKAVAGVVSGTLADSGGLSRDFDVIFCLDALALMPSDELSRALANLKRHAGKLCYVTVGLAPEGENPILVSAAPSRAVQPAQWWLEQFQKTGFDLLDNRVARDAAGQDQWLHVFLAPNRAAKAGAKAVAPRKAAPKIPPEVAAKAAEIAAAKAGQKDAPGTPAVAANSKGTPKIPPEVAAKAAEIIAAKAAQENLPETAPDSRPDIAPDMAAERGRKAAPEEILRAAMELHRKGAGQKAAPLYEQVLKAKADDPDALHGLGMIAMDSGDHAESERLIRAAIESDGGKASFHSNLGHLLAVEGRPDEAFEAFARAIALAPDVAVAHSNLGNALRDSGRIYEAEEAFGRALELEPGLAMARASLAQMKLLIGNYDEGWAELRWGFESGARKWYGLPLPEWDGAALADGGLVLWGDWGIGDQLMVLRLLSRLSGRVARTVCVCDQRLVPILARAFPEIVFQAPCDPLQLRSRHPEMTHQLPICDLARLLCPDPKDLDDGGAFLKPDAARVAALKARYGAGKPVVGLAWRGGAFAETKALRSVPLAQWAPILGLPDVTFVSLQNGDHGPEIAAAETALEVEILVDKTVDQMRDLDGFAAQVAAMDRILSVDCTCVHLAGALGVATEVLLPLVPDWRWGLSGETSPWYDSLKLHRQVKARDWGRPLAAARQALQAACRI